MNSKSVLHVLGALLIFIGGSFLLPLACSWYYGDGDFVALLISMAITIAVGFLMWGLTPDARELQAREGFAVVTFGWILLACFGALPFVFCKVHVPFTDAFFETMSGFTTTGATILSNVEGLPHGVLFWRSLTHWMGGMGIIVLSLAILPMLGVGGMQLFKAEVPGPSVDKLQPRIQDTAKILWGVYVVLSAVETILLLIGGMSLFDALCHTFGTMATGGFSTKNVGVGYFGSAYIEYVIAVFMVLAGANFALHYHALRGRFIHYLHSSEFLFYLGIISFFTFAIGTTLVMAVHGGYEVGFRKAFFQVASILTTTGFHSTDYELWSVFAQLSLVFLMFIGGCAGSTGGGVKVVRIFVTIKFMMAQLKKLVHPHAVIPVRFDRKSISQEAMTGILGFLLVYFGLVFFGSLFMATQGLDLVSSVSTVISTLGNIGPGVGTIGPTENFSHVSDFGKWVLSFLMLAGRLEIYTVLVIFNKSFWFK